MARRSYSQTARRLTFNANVSAGAGSFTSAEDASAYPTGSAGAFYVTLDRGQASEETLLVTSRSGNTFTLSGTTANTHASSTGTIEHTISAVDLDEANQHINDTAQDHHTQYHNAARHAAVSHTNAMMAANSVNTTQIVDGAVTNAKLGAASVTGPKIQDLAVTAGKLDTVSPPVGTNNIQANAVTEGKINAGAVTNAKIGPAAVTSAKLADAAVTNAKAGFTVNNSPAITVTQVGTLTGTTVGWSCVIGELGFANISWEMTGGSATAGTQVVIDLSGFASFEAPEDVQGSWGYNDASAGLITGHVKGLNAADDTVVLWAVTAGGAFGSNAGQQLATGDQILLSIQWKVA